MKRLITFLPLLYLTIGLFGQIINNSYGKKLYDNGTVLLELGDYKGADSLFTEALCTFSNENVYYNRGISRLFQGDTLSCCNDLDVAVRRYLDAGAAPLFNELCCSKVDTFYYDKRYNLTDKTNYKYYEEIRNLKYYPIILGFLHDIEANNIGVSTEMNCYSKIVGANIMPTDIVAAYVVKDSNQVFNFCLIPPVVIDEDKYDEFKKRFSTVFNVQYGDLKKQNKPETIRLWFQVEIDTCGKVLTSNFTHITPNIETRTLDEKLKEGLSKIAKYYPPFKPALVMNKKVKYCFDDFIEF